MPQHVPLSVTLSPGQIEWLDAKRQHGNLTRSAALRVALDRLIEEEQSQQPAFAAGGRRGR